MSAKYRFETPFPKGHFVRDYLEYAAKRTDASHAYHEAAGLALLALATPNVRAHLAPYPYGLPTNLYLLLVGDSTRSRKSTAINLATDVADASIPRSRIADAFSPEAFVETLAARPHNSTLWAPDEFGETLVKLRSSKYMAGLQGLLLTVYGGSDYEYRRHSKRVKGGDKVEDVDFIKSPNLSILGATTPAIFETLTDADVTSGLLPRFAVVMPTDQPARKPFFAVSSDIEIERNGLVQRLQTIFRAAIAHPHDVGFQDGALEVLDRFAATLETQSVTNDTVRTMQQRLVAMTVKLAMLSAVGWSGGLTETATRLMVAKEDAEFAVQVVQRWSTDAVTFAGRVGESFFEKKVAKCLELVQTHTAIPRSMIAQNAHVPKRLLDDIEATLLDRQQITVGTSAAKSGPKEVVIWALPRTFQVIEGGGGD